MSASATQLFSHRALRWCALLFLANVLLRVGLALTVPVLFKETVFWEWSQFPALGYLEHPPLIAWVMRLCSLLNPANPLIASRGLAVLLGSTWPWLCYWLAWQLFRDPSITCWAFTLSLCLPLLNLAGTFLLTETLLIPFVLLFVGLFHSAVVHGKRRDWCFAGIALGLALLSKLMAFLSLAGIVVFLTTSKEHRQWLRRKEPYLGLSVAILIFSPFLLWNWRHDWSSFSFQLWGRHQEHFGPSLKKLGEVLFEQIPNAGLLLLPIVGCLLTPLRAIPMRWRSSYSLARAQALVVSIFFLLAGSVTETHPHWTLIAYPFAVICLAVAFRAGVNLLLVQHTKTICAVSVVGLCLLVCLVPFGRAMAHRVDAMSWPGPLNKKLAKVQHALFDWEQLASRLSECLADLGDEPGAVLLTDNEELASMVGYQRRQVVLNLAPLFWDKQTSQRGYVDFSALAHKRGIFFTDKDALFDLELLFLFDGVKRLPDIELPAAVRRFKQFKAYQVGKLRAEALAQLKTAPVAHWVALTKRHPVHVLEVRNDPKHQHVEVVLAGWIGRRASESPAAMALRVDGETLARFRAGDPVAEVVAAHQRSGGKDGAPVAACGFTVVARIARAAKRCQLVVFLPYGELVIFDRATNELRRDAALD